MAGKVYAIWGDILCEWNELERAEAFLRKAVELCRREGNVAALGLSYLYLLRVLWARQNFSSMEEALHRLEELAQGASVPVWINRNIIAWKSWVWITQGRTKEAAQILRENGITPETDPVFRGEGEYLSLARLLIAEGHPAEAGRLVDRLFSAAEANDLLPWQITFLILRALACEAQGMHEAAIDTVEKALSLAEEEGYIQIFIEGGPPMARLIHEVAAREFAPQYTRRLLAAFPSIDLPASRRPDQAEELIEPLSPRELEVLHLLADGLSNQEIAGRLYLSLRTIKFHTSNIYGKLGVKSRTEAIARGRALGLLSP
jgi:LuxR family maltose regulon positive regulatory protein